MKRKDGETVTRGENTSLSYLGVDPIFGPRNRALNAPRGPAKTDLPMVPRSPRSLRSYVFLLRLRKHVGGKIQNQ